MTTTLEAIASALAGAERAHAAAFASVNGEDPDWAVFYAGWLVDRSLLLSLVESPPERNALSEALADIDRRYVAENPDESWDRYYARDLIERFGATNAQAP